jgi:hypothetical protein
MLVTYVLPLVGRSKTNNNMYRMNKKQLLKCDAYFCGKVTCAVSSGAGLSQYEMSKGTEASIQTRTVTWPKDGSTYSRSRLQRHRFIRHPVHSVRYSVVQINPSLLTMTLYSSVIMTFFYDDMKYSVLFMTL